MKTILLLTFLLGGLHIADAGTTEIFQDNLLATTSYEETSLGEIYLALPQDFFEVNYRERIDFLIRGRIQFDPDKKRIYVPGDGGQGRVTVIVLKQTEKELVLDVALDFEGNQSGWILSRQSAKWIGTLKTK